MKWLILFCFAGLERLVFTQTTPCEGTLPTELNQIWQELVELEQDIDKADSTNERDGCFCDCRMSGLPGKRGIKGERGPDGFKGARGQKGEDGFPGAGRIIGPIGPLPEDDPEFLDSVKLRWKGYEGPWGRIGEQGSAGDEVVCNCEDRERQCREWCAPIKGEWGLNGDPGLPGLQGLPGPKGDRGKNIP